MNIDSIQNGVVLDHIQAGKSMDIYRYLHLDQLDCSVAIIKNVRGKTQAGDTVKTELIYDREKVRAESCPDFSYISQKLR